MLAEIEYFVDSIDSNTVAPEPVANAVDTKPFE